MAPSAELHLRIRTADGQKGVRPWRITLKKATGQPVREALAYTGDTVKFDNLVSGIYIYCLSGLKGESRCRSVDLTIPSDAESHRIAREVQEPKPPMNQSGRHRVSLVRLAVPEEARKEFRQYEEAILRGDRDEAVEHLEHALEVDPEYVAALNNLGAYYHRNKEYEVASNYFRQALALDPDFHAAWVNLGGSLIARGKTDEALAATSRAIALRPEDPLSNYQMGVAHYYLRHYAKAKEYFHRLSRIDPYSAHAPDLFLAQIALVEQDYPQAQTHIRQFIRLHPNSPEVPRLQKTHDFLDGKVVSKTGKSH